MHGSGGGGAGDGGSLVDRARAWAGCAERPGWTALKRLLQAQAAAGHLQGPHEEAPGAAAAAAAAARGQSETPPGWCSHVEVVSVQRELPPALWYGVTSEDCAHEVIAVRKAAATPPPPPLPVPVPTRVAPAVGPLPGIMEVLRADGLGLD